MLIIPYNLRILKRPFDADAYLSDLLNETVVRKSSVVQRIWNSLLLSSRLTRKIRDSEGPGGRAANLKAAKHRFESFAAPLGRMLLHLDAFLELMQEVSDERAKSQEGQDCWNWLQGLDQEKLCQLGMLADCADEILVATREVDAEDVDTSTMHKGAKSLLGRLDALFNKRQCLGLGYTQHVIECLKRQHCFIGPEGQLLLIGGSTLEVSLNNCFRRMRAYCALVADVVATEFPDYELFCAFSLFDLTPQAHQQLERVNDETVSNLQRLSQAFNVNSSALQDQWHRLKYVANEHFTSKAGISNKIAWQLAVQSCQRHHMTRHSWNMEALLPVLWRFVGWTAATSGVEQNFSKALRSIGLQRGSLTPANEETAIRFAVFKPTPDEVIELISKARELWAAHYGAPRTAAAAGHRCDKGVPKRKLQTTDSAPADDAVRTEAAWLRKRRNAARDAGQRLGDASALSVSVAKHEPGWTSGHEDEHQFQKKKRAKKELHAYEDGLLLPHEIRDNMAEDLREMKAKQRKDDAKKKHDRTKCSSRAKTLTLKAGSRAFSATDDQNVHARLLSRGCVVGDLGLNTQIIIVQDPTSLNKQQLWIAVLTGALVCSVESVLGLTGPFLQYEAAIEKPRKIHMTPEFQTKHRTIAGLIRDACQIPTSEWKLYNHSGNKRTSLGGDQGLKASKFLKSICKISRKESRG